MKLSIKVVPGSSRDCVAGWLGDTLKIRVSAPAERGKANAAVKKVLSKALGIPGRSIRIVSGKTSALKLAEIDDVEEADIRRRLRDIARR